MIQPSTNSSAVGILPNGAATATPSAQPVGDNSFQAELELQKNGSQSTAQPIGVTVVRSEHRTTDENARILPTIAAASEELDRVPAHALTGSTDTENSHLTRGDWAARPRVLDPVAVDRLAAVSALEKSSIASPLMRETLIDSESKGTEDTDAPQGTDAALSSDPAAISTALAIIGSSAPVPNETPPLLTPHIDGRASSTTADTESTPTVAAPPPKLFAPVEQFARPGSTTTPDSQSVATAAQSFGDIFEPTQRGQADSQGHGHNERSPARDTPSASVHSTQIDARSLAEPASIANPLAVSESDISPSPKNSDGIAVLPTTLTQAAHGSPDSRTASSPHISVPVGSPDWGKQVGSHITWLVSGKEHSATLTVTPEDLGTVTVSLTFDDNVVHAHFGAAESQVRTALDNAMPQLREMLQSVGIELGNASVTPNGGGTTEQERRELASSFTGGQQSNKGNGTGKPDSSGTEQYGEASEGLLQRPGKSGLIDIFA